MDKDTEYYVRSQEKQLIYSSKSLRSVLTIVSADLLNISKRLVDFEKNINNGEHKPLLLNNLGELQGRGVGIDVAIAAICEQHTNLRELLDFHKS